MNGVVTRKVCSQTLLWRKTFRNWQKFTKIILGGTSTPGAPGTTPSKSDS